MTPRNHGSAADEGTVLVRREGHVAWITLNRPQKRNALDRAMVAALTAALDAAERDAEVRVVALEGAGKDFCAGADLGEIEQALHAPMPANLADAEALGELFRRPRELSKPVVAVVRGRALAGGCGLATACDLVLAGESASFGYPEVGIGFVPAMVMAILRRNLGEKRAFELVSLGETLSAAEARELGLVNRVFPDDALEAGAAELLERLARRSPSALHLSKRLLYRQDGVGYDEGIRSGAAVNVLARQTADAQAGIARFAGTRPQEG